MRNFFMGVSAVGVGAAVGLSIAHGLNESAPKPHPAPSGEVVVSFYSPGHPEVRTVRVHGYVSHVEGGEAVVCIAAPPEVVKTLSRGE